MLSWKRVVFPTLLLLLVIIIEFSLLTSYRLLALPYYAGELCDLNRPDSAACVTRLTLEILYQTEWRMITFMIYALTTIGIFWLTLRNSQISPANHCIVNGIIAFAMLSVMIDSSQVEVITVEPIACLTGALIAALLIKRHVPHSP